MTTKTDDQLDADGKRAPPDVRRLCLKIANQAGKGQWWNAMAYAAELVVVCQNGCHTEIERVAERRRLTPKKSKSKSKTTRTRTRK
jgi:hypothetical protein